MRLSRAEREATWKEREAQRKAEQAERSRKEAEDRAHRQSVGALSRVLLYKRLSENATEAFDELCVLMKKEGDTFDPHEGWHWIQHQLPKYVADELIKFIHAYERAGGTVFVYNRRASWYSSAIPTPSNQPAAAGD